MQRGRMQSASHLKIPIPHPTIDTQSIKQYYKQKVINKEIFFLIRWSIRYFLRGFIRNLRKKCAKIASEWNGVPAGPTVVAWWCPDLNSCDEAQSDLILFV